MNKHHIAGLVKNGRRQKGITQQELADKAGISLRSVQRIENAEVVPRLYTLRVLGEHLGFNTTNFEDIGDGPTGDQQPASNSQKSRRAGKLILSIGVGAVILSATGAYISQSAHFPETNFEWFTLITVLLTAYMLFLYRVWR